MVGTGEELTGLLFSNLLLQVTGKQQMRIELTKRKKRGMEMRKKMEGKRKEQRVGEKKEKTGKKRKVRRGEEQERGGRKRRKEKGRAKERQEKTDM